MNNYKRTIALILGILIVFSAGCGKGKEKEEGSENEKVFRRALPAKVKGLDTVQASDLASNVIICQVYETLLQYAYLERPYKVEPCLAEAMPVVSDDGLIYTFKIKEGVYFQDDACFTATEGKGRELTAEDFVYAFKRIADFDNQSEGWWIFDGRIEGLNEFRKISQETEGKTDYDLPVSGLQVLDCYTLRIKLKFPYPQFLYIFTLSYTAPVPREAVECYGEEIINHPVGTGPFRLEKWVRGSKVVLVRNPTFRDDFYPTRGEPGDKELGLLSDAGKKLPFLDRVEIKIILEDQPRWLEFVSGNLDITVVPKDNFDSAIGTDMELTPEMKSKGIRLWKTPLLQTNYISFNMDDPLFKDNKLLRQALSLAYDESRVITMFNNRLISAVGPIPPGIKGYDDDLVNPYRQYNPDKAKELLAKSGYPNGKDKDGNPLKLTYDAGGSDTTIRQMAELFVDDMSKLGIEVDVVYNTWPSFMKKLRQRQTQVCGLAWIADYPDAENFLQLFYVPNSSPGPNNANFNHPEFNRLYEKIKTMPDSPERIRICKKMVDMLVEECPWIFNFHPLEYALYQERFRNYKPHDLAYNKCKYYKIDNQLKRNRTAR